jgi:hypothetical protein
VDDHGQVHPLQMEASNRLLLDHRRDEASRSASLLNF